MSVYLPGSTWPLDLLPPGVTMSQMLDQLAAELRPELLTWDLMLYRGVRNLRRLENAVRRSTPSPDGS